jgi:hypothetical protein
MLSTDAARAPLDDPRGFPHRRDGNARRTALHRRRRDGENFLLQRRRGVFIAFFQDGIEYDAIAPKREQSVQPTWRARRVDREIEEDQDVGERRRPTPRRYPTRHADADAAEAEQHRTRGLHPEARLDDDVFDVPPPPPPPPPPTQPVPEEALIRAVRAVLSQQPAIVAQHPATPAPTLSPLAALDKEDANMARSSAPSAKAFTARSSQHGQ